MADRLLALVISALGGACIIAAMQFEDLDFVDPLGHKSFPIIVGIMSIVAAVMLVFEKYRNREKPGESESAESRKLAKETKGHPLAAACVLGWMLFLYLLLDAIGFIVILFVFLFGLMAFFNRGKWLLNGAISVSFSLAFYFVFTELIGVPVARGILAF